MVKYIGGIELYYMDAADYVNPDYSLKNKANRKVRDLSIVRTAGHKNMVMVILQRISLRK